MEIKRVHAVVELFFDQTTESAIRAIWRALVAAGIPVARDSRPHVSLAASRERDTARFRRVLAVFANEATVTEVALESWGVFPSGERVVFLAPVVTCELLGLHAEFHRRFAAVGGVTLPYYLPGSRIPHCTQAAGIPRDHLAKAIEVCYQMPLSVRGRFESIGLVEYQPRTEHFTFRFGTR